MVLLVEEEEDMSLLSTESKFRDDPVVSWKEEEGVDVWLPPAAPPPALLLLLVLPPPGV